MTVDRQDVLLCPDCFEWHGEKSSRTFCDCSVAADTPGACSCPGDVVRRAPGLAGWAVIPGTDRPELSREPCKACCRPLGFGRRHLVTVFSLTPAPRTPEALTLSGTAASREAWAKAASPASLAAMAPIAEQQGTGT